MADTISAQQLREITYEREDMHDLSINLKTLEQNCPLTQTSETSRIGCAIDSNIADLQPLGQLDSLPLEIIQTILQQLDLHALTLMQSLNHRSKFLVESLPQYRGTVAHAPNALRAILSTGLASHFSIEDLYSALCWQGCFLCGSFGAYLYLLSCRRCCWLCLAEASDALPIPRDVVTYSFGLPDSAVRQLPCLRSLPGRYSLDCFQGDTHKRRLVLISTKAAKEAGITLHGSEEAMEAYAANLNVVRRFPPAVNRNRKAGNRNVLRLQGRRLVQNPSREYARGPPWSGCGPYEPQRFMAAIRFPTLDVSNGTIEWGISCKGCRDGPPNEDESREWEAIYTQRGYLAHFDQCKWSKQLSASLKTECLTMLDSS